jgi:YjbE family integral membrane protein
MSHLWALAQIFFIDFSLTADNAVVLALVVAGMPREQGQRALLLGISAATLLRIVLALVAVRLLRVVGLTLAGGFLLLWVCWRMWREMQHDRGGASLRLSMAPQRETVSFRRAVATIGLADLSMSLDNVLAVAGVARGDKVMLAIGLTLSVLAMGMASTLLVGLVKRFPVLVWFGLLIVLQLALRMIWEGSHQVLFHDGYST